MYTIEFSREAMEDLKWFRETDQNIILDGIEDGLRHQATVETRNRGRLRPNQTAEWKLRIGDFRVYYDAAKIDRTVSIVAIGLKVGNRVYFRGQQRTL